MHPRLLTSLILVEPVIVPDTFSGYGPLLSKLSLKRRDIWPSRSAAIKAARKTHEKWDERVLERWALHGYRSLPTALYPQNLKSDTEDTCDGPVTLASTKHQEVMQYVRPNFGAHMPLGQKKSTTGPAYEPLFQADVIGPPTKISPFYRSEPVIAWKLLDHVRPSVLYIFGGTSPISKPNICAEILQRTGAGIGGSGGVMSGQVKETRIEGCGHQVPLEEVAEIASAIGTWIESAVQRWREDEIRIAKGWTNLPTKDKLSVSAEWTPRLEAACKVYEQKSRL
jgi:pimeloyl-ACP methyl ester carboxylesterase